MRLNFKCTLCIIAGFLMLFSRAYAGATWSNPKNLKVYIPQGDETRVQAARTAFATWTRKTEKMFVFYYIKNPKKADIEVKFVEKPKPQCGSSALACTKMAWTGEYPNKKMAHATVIMAKYTNEGKLLKKDQYYTAFLHEIGHAMGMTEHDENPKSIMYPYDNYKVSDIQPFDIANLKKLYKKK